MHYVVGEGVDKGQKRRRWPLFVAGTLLAGGLYLLYNTLSPMLPDLTVDAQATTNKLKTEAPQVKENRLYLPQINVDVPIVDINGNEAAALDKGAIHRAPENGNPKDGGNYVLAAHRFTLGLTPSETRAKSPFYHIDEMKVNDQVYVDYSGTRYAYKITSIDPNVAPTDVAIENRTQSPALTIYSCGLTGSDGNRYVLHAELLGTVSWQEGKPVVEPIL